MASMSLLARPPPPAPKPSYRDTAAQFFETDAEGVTQLRELDDDQLRQLEEVNEAFLESRTFRVGAASTLDRHDRHLLEYRQAMILKFRFEDRLEDLRSTDPRSRDNDRLFFPVDNTNQVYANIGWYLMWICPRLRPRSSERPAIRLATLGSRRQSMLYWIKIYMDDAPSYRTMLSKTNRPLYYAGKKYGVDTTKYSKPYFGRPELQYLLDQDMAATPNVEVAEAHHLAWILACICGLRPGSIGNSKHRPNAYLRWEHIKISRDPVHKYKFTLKLTIPYMKGFQDVHRLGYGSGGSMELTINPPQNPDNIPICPTYRLLTMAVRRGLLESYNTVNELLADDRLYIRIKEEARAKFIFPATRGGGRYPDWSKPASSQSFTTYLRKRAIDYGFTGNPTMYAFRRKAGTEVDRAENRAIARRFMHHDPRSVVFEESYDEGNFDLDVGRIMYGEDYRAGTEEMRELAHEVLYRVELHMSPTEQRRQIDEAVNQWVRKDAPNLQLEVARCRSYAMKALRQIAADLHSKSFTAPELQERMKEMKGPSKLTIAMRERVQQNLDKLKQRSDESAELGAGIDVINEDDVEEEDSGSVGAIDSPEGMHGDLGDQLGVRFGDEQEQSEGDDDDDIETSAATSNEKDLPRSGNEAGTICDNCIDAFDMAKSTSTLFNSLTPTVQNFWIEKLESYLEVDTWANMSVTAAAMRDKLPAAIDALKTRCQRLAHTIETDLPTDQEKITTASYELAVVAFCDLMLEGQVLPGTPRQCIECLADDTVTTGKHKVYKNQSDLLRHVQSQEHSPWKRWLRKVSLAKESDPAKLYRCYPACGRTYTWVNKLQVHLEGVVKKIGEGKTDEKHQEGLEADGWLLPNFQRSRRSVDQEQQITKTRNKERIVRYGHLPQLTELTEARPALIGAQPNPYVFVGPGDQDLNLLRYPKDMQHVGSAPQAPRSSDSDSWPSLAEALEAKGMSDSVEWGNSKLPKF